MIFIIKKKIHILLDSLYAPQMCALCFPSANEYQRAPEITVAASVSRHPPAGGNCMNESLYLNIAF